MENLKEIVLEASTNSHRLKASDIKVLKKIGSTIQLHNEDGVVVHGEHGSLKVESKNVIKYVQMELNPVTKKLQEAYD